MMKNSGGATPDKYEFEVQGSREEIADVLTGVVDGIFTGAVRLGSGAEVVSVDFPEDLGLEIEFEEDDGELSLELELGWPAPDDAGTDQSIENPADGTSDVSTLVRSAGGGVSLARFEVFQDRGDAWRWRLRHRNGNIIATSGEGYTRKHNAEKGLQSVIENSPDAAMTETSTD